MASVCVELFFSIASFSCLFLLRGGCFFRQTKYTACDEIRFLVHLHFWYFSFEYYRTAFVFGDEILTTFSLVCCWCCQSVALCVLFAWVTCHRLCVYILRVHFDNDRTTFFIQSNKRRTFLLRRNRSSPFVVVVGENKTIIWIQIKSTHTENESDLCLFWFTWIYVTPFFYFVSISFLRFYFCRRLNQNYIQCDSDDFFFIQIYTGYLQR